MEPSAIVAILVALVLVWAAFLVIFWALRPKGVSVRELVGLIPDILRLLRSLIVDGRAPLDVRLVVVGLVAWIVSPIDLIPEFIPVLGPLDDAVVAALILRHLVRTAGREVVAEHWRGDPAMLTWLLRLFESEPTVRTRRRDRNDA